MNRVFFKSTLKDYFHTKMNFKCDILPPKKIKVKVKKQLRYKDLEV